MCYTRHQPEDGLIYSKPTIDILRNALGPQVLELISTAWTPESGVTNLETAQIPANVGSKDTSGQLQVRASKSSFSRTELKIINITAS